MCVTGIAGAVIATACFYVLGAAFSVILAGKREALAMMLAWPMWLKFFGIAFLVCFLASAYALRAQLRAQEKESAEQVLPEAYNLDDDEQLEAFLHGFSDEEQRAYQDAVLEKTQELDDLLGDLFEDDGLSAANGEEEVRDDI